MFANLVLAEQDFLLLSGKNNSMKHSISIILVNWNGRKWLSGCLGSLCSQTYQDREIFFVDNGSTDGSVEFVRKNFPEVKIVESEKNLGFAGGNNLGVRSAKGNLLLFLNTDVWLESDFLERLVDFYEKEKLDVAAPLEADYEGNRRKPYVTQIDPFGYFIYPTQEKHKQKGSFYLTGVCLLVSKKLYEKSGGFDEDFFMYCEEVDWFWRLQMQGKRVAYAENIFVNHAGSGSAGTGIKYQTFLWRNQNMLQMLLKNYAWYNLLWVLPVYLLQNFIEAVVFLVFAKPKIALSYFQAWWFNIRNIGKTSEKRKRIQERRKKGDVFVMQKMYWGSAKINHFISYLR